MAPAMIWVVAGALLVGCVHDFAALVVSLRAKGQSIGKVAEGVIGPRAKALFLGIIFFGVALAMGVLNAHDRFAAPAAAPVLLNVAFIACALALTEVAANGRYLAIEGQSELHSR